MIIFCCKKTKKALKEIKEETESIIIPEPSITDITISEWE